ncbi:MAG: phosphotransferase family protein, partial [Acidimicrobiales bacterium]|nr:phosphotransferase family protein [Acidimicrobiales bacterium]
PEGRRLSSAHDMGREYRVQRALASHPEAGVPVPTPVAYCDDPAVNDTPLYVMEFVAGRILRSPDDARDLTADQCDAATDALVNTQIAMHHLDPTAVGLGDLGRPDGYLERQLKRWMRQYEAGKFRELPALESLHTELLRRLPAQQDVGLVHGDYRFDNAVLRDDFSMAAVLDWELCTLGDPVADFAWSVSFWSDPDQDWDFGSPSPTRHPAFARRTQVIERYAERSGYDLGEFPYYQAFCYWKMAAVTEGAAGRIRSGGGGGMSSGDATGPMAKVLRLLDLATEAVDQL